MPARQIKADPSRLAVFKDYVRNIATWLQPIVEWMNPEAEERFTRKTVMSTLSSGNALTRRRT